MTRQEFAQGMALLTGAVGKPMHDDQLAAWFAMLSDLTAGQLREGIVQTLRTHQYAGFPPLGTVRANALGSADCSQRAILAWQSVVLARIEVRRLASPRFSDPLVNAVIHAMGGWLEVCKKSVELQWLRKEFCETYAALSKLPRLPDDLAGPLGNWNNRGCRNERFDEQGRVLIPHIRCLTVDPPDVPPIALRVLDDQKSLPGCDSEKLTTQSGPTPIGAVARRPINS